MHTVTDDISGVNRLDTTATKEGIYEFFFDTAFRDLNGETQENRVVYLGQCFNSIEDQKMRQMLYSRLTHYVSNQSKLNWQTEILSKFLKHIRGTHLVSATVGSILAHDDYVLGQEEVMLYFGHSPALPESHEKLRNIADMTGIVCEDDTVVRGMLQAFAGKIGAKKMQSPLDTRKDLVVLMREEQEVLHDVDLLITDINDTDDTTDPSGGLRRGEMILAKGGLVVFLSGHNTNEQLIHDTFGSRFPDRYIFIKKPISDPAQFKKQIQDFVAAAPK